MHGCNSSPNPLWNTIDAGNPLQAQNMTSLAARYDI